MSSRPNTANPGFIRRIFARNAPRQNNYMQLSSEPSSLVYPNQVMINGVPTSPASFQDRYGHPPTTGQGLAGLIGKTDSTGRPLVTLKQVVNNESPRLKNTHPKQTMKANAMSSVSARSNVSSPLTPKPEMKAIAVNPDGSPVQNSPASTSSYTSKRPAPINTNLRHNGKSSLLTPSSSGSSSGGMRFDSIYPSGTKGQQAADSPTLKPVSNQAPLDLSSTSTATNRSLGSPKIAPTTAGLQPPMMLGSNKSALKELGEQRHAQREVARKGILKNSGSVNTGKVFPGKGMSVSGKTVHPGAVKPPPTVKASSSMMGGGMNSAYGMMMAGQLVAGEASKIAAGIDAVNEQNRLQRLENKELEKQWEADHKQRLGRT